MARVAYKELTVGNEVPDSTALALLPVPDDIEPGTRVFNSDIGHNFSYTISTAALDPDVVVEVFGIVGARWILDTSDSEVASVTALPDGGITVDNTDPQNPVLSLSDDTGGTLAEIYAAGLAGTPVVDNTMDGQSMSAYFNFNTGEFGVKIFESPAGNGVGFDTVPLEWLERHFTGPFHQPALTAEQTATYDDLTLFDFIGGTISRKSVGYNAGRYNIDDEYTYVSRPGIGGGPFGYLPAYLNSDPYTTWEHKMFNRIGGGSTSRFLFNSDGLHYRTCLFPGGDDAPYSFYANQLDMYGLTGGGRPVNGSELVFDSGHVAILGPGQGNNEIGHLSWVMDDANLGSGEVAGHMSQWIRSTLGGPLVEIADYYDDHIAFNVPITSQGGTALVDHVSASTDFKTATSFTVIPIAAGKRFLPVSAFVEFTNIDTLTVGPSIEIGNNAGEDNVAPALAVANTVVTDSAVPFVMSATPSIITLTTTAVTAHCTVNATATTCTGRVHVIGVYV